MASSRLFELNCRCLSQHYLSLRFENLPLSEKLFWDRFVDLITEELHPPKPPRKRSKKHG